MSRHTTLLLLAVLVAQGNTAPQLISFKDGKLGVNFGGYHAGVGLGGLLGGGTAGGLYAEAGTPHGQAARAGLGGVVDANGQTAGGLFAGATAGGNVGASAGLAGGVAADKAAGTGYAAAQAGNHYASSGLVGDTRKEIARRRKEERRLRKEIEKALRAQQKRTQVVAETKGGESSSGGDVGFSFSGSKSLGVSKAVIKETEIQPVQHVEVEPIKTEVHKEVNIDSLNEVNPVPLAADKNTETKIDSDVTVTTKVQPAVIVKEIYAEPPPAVIEKHIVRYKPRHHFRKTAYIGGYIGGDVPPPPPLPPVVVYKNVQPVIEKRIDVGSESAVNAEAGGSVHSGGAGNVAVTKQVTFQRNPSFFADIFNIPIQTLRAVGNFLGNTAGSTSVSVQKSASVHAGAESDSTYPKHAASSTSSSEGHVSIQTPAASQIIGDIFAGIPAVNIKVPDIADKIPINTLGAVNKFLENNVPARKTVQVSGDGEPTRVRLGPHARRRANKRVVVVKESSVEPESEIVEE